MSFSLPSTALLFEGVCFHAKEYITPPGFHQTTEKNKINHICHSQKIVLDVWIKSKVAIACSGLSRSKTVLFLFLSLILYSTWTSVFMAAKIQKSRCMMTCWRSYMISVDCGEQASSPGRRLMLVTGGEKVAVGVKISGGAAKGHRSMLG